MDVALAATRRSRFPLDRTPKLRYTTTMPFGQAGLVSSASMLLYLWLIQRNQFPTRQHVSLHRGFNLLSCLTRRQGQSRIQCIQRKHIVVRNPSRRARASISDFVEIVAALQGIIQLAALLRYSLGQLPLCSRQVIKQPMHKCAAGSIRVCDDQRQALGCRRRRAPRERKRSVLAIASIFSRDFASLQARTRPLELRWIPSLDLRGRKGTTRHSADQQQEPVRNNHGLGKARFRKIHEALPSSGSRQLPPAILKGDFDPRYELPLFPPPFLFCDFFRSL